MLDRKAIIDYHLSEFKDNIRGFEYEIFCLDKKYKRLFFKKGVNIGLQDILNYFIKDKGFCALDCSKTIGVKKAGVKFTLEPGSQLEYSTRQNPGANALIKEFLTLIEKYQNLKKKFNLRFSDISLFPFGKAEDAPLLQAPRYRVMDKYFQKSGTLGKFMMRNTTSLQLTFSYESLEDLEKKVNRLLFLKPILLVLSSNSRIFQGKDTKYHSFRDMVWKDTDSKRCGDPGENFWYNGKWTLNDYIGKVLNAPVIFDVKNKDYKAGSSEPLLNLIDDVDIESYIFHNSTVFTDIRIKNYIEMRYMDNPTIFLTPGIILLVESILSQDKIWSMFSKALPYEFSEVPAMAQKLNAVNQESFDLWNQAIKPVIIDVIGVLKLSHPKKFHPYLDALAEKANKVCDPAVNLEINPKNILEYYSNQFDNNLVKFTANQ